MTPLLFWFLLFQACAQIAASVHKLRGFKSLHFGQHLYENQFLLIKTSACRWELQMQQNKSVF